VDEDDEDGDDVDLNTKGRAYADNTRSGDSGDIMSGPRICFQLHWTNNRQGLLYHDNRAVTIAYNGNGSVSKLGSPTDISRTPLGMVGSARSFWSAGIDAMFPNPPQPGKDTHFFCGEWYFSLGSNSGVITRGPMKITQAWPLLGRFNFRRVNVAQPVPFNHPNFADQVWFFSGNRGFLAKNTYHPNGTITQELQRGITSPYILTQRWRQTLGAPTVNFQTVDTMFPNPDNPSQLFVFSGSRYIVINIHADTNATLVRGPNYIRNDFPALSDFY